MSTRLRWARMCAPGLATAALLHCGGNSSSWTPLVQTVDPQPVPTGATKIGVIGKRFAPGATVYWNGRAQPTTFSSDSRLQITLDTDATMTSGVASVTVANEGSYRSREIRIEIVDAPLNLVSIEPSAVAPGAPDFTLTVSGAGFVPSSKVRWNDVDVDTQFLSSTELHARISAGLIALGSGVVTVAIPSCILMLPCPFLSTSNPLICSIGPGTGVMTVPQVAAEIASDPARARLYVSVPATAPTHANGVLALDPASGQTVASVSAPNAGVLAVAGNGQFLYADVADSGGSSTVTRYDLPDLTGQTSWQQGPVPNFIADIQVAPGAPHTVAAALGNGSVVILDDGVRRGATLKLSSAVSLQWGADATQLFAADPDLILLSVDANGIAPPPVYPIAVLQEKHIHYEPTTRRVYTDYGFVVDEQGANASTFPISLDERCVMTPDGGGGKAFFACLERVGSNLPWPIPDRLIIRSFDLTTKARLAVLMLEIWPKGSSPEDPLRVVRWGSDGLAVATRPSSRGPGRIYLYSGPFVQ